jgi:hypothetical protein
MCVRIKFHESDSLICNHINELKDSLEPTDEVIELIYARRDGSMISIGIQTAEGFIEVGRPLYSC